MIVVSNTSAVTNLAAVGQLDLLQQLQFIWEQRDLVRSGKKQAIAKNQF